MIDKKPKYYNDLTKEQRIEIRNQFFKISKECDKKIKEFEKLYLLPEKRRLKLMDDFFHNRISAKEFIYSNKQIINYLCKVKI